METLQWIITVVVGFLAIWFKARDIYNRYLAKLQQRAADYINEAEAQYRDATKAGGKKMAFAVDGLYRLLPDPLKLVISKEMIQTIVQNAFDQMEIFAMEQLDKKLK